MRMCRRYSSADLCIWSRCLDSSSRVESRRLHFHLTALDGRARGFAFDRSSRHSRDSTRLDEAKGGNISRDCCARPYPSLLYALETGTREMARFAIPRPRTVSAHRRRPAHDALTPSNASRRDPPSGLRPDHSPARPQTRERYAQACHGIARPGRRSLVAGRAQQRRRGKSQPRPRVHTQVTTRGCIQSC